MFWQDTDALSQPSQLKALPQLPEIEKGQKTLTEPFQGAILHSTETWVLTLNKVCGYNELECPYLKICQKALIWSANLRKWLNVSYAPDTVEVTTSTGWGFHNTLSDIYNTYASDAEKMELIKLSTDSLKVIQSQKFSDTEPGFVVKDFNAFVNRVMEKPVPLSKG